MNRGDGHQPVTEEERNEQSDRLTKMEKKAIFQNAALANKLEKLLITVTEKNLKKRERWKVKEIIRVIFLWRRFLRQKPPLVGRF